MEQIHPCPCPLALVSRRGGHLLLFLPFEILFLVVLCTMTWIEGDFLVGWLFFSFFLLPLTGVVGVEVVWLVCYESHESRVSVVLYRHLAIRVLDALTAAKAQEILTKGMRSRDFSDEL